MITVELVSFVRDQLDQEELDTAHLPFLDYFIMADDEITFQGLTNFDVVIRDFLKIDEDFDKDGENVEWDYFLLTKERAIDLVKKISETSLKDLDCRGYVVDIINKLIKNFDWENEILAITLGED